MVLVSLQYTVSHKSLSMVLHRCLWYFAELVVAAALYPGSVLSTRLWFAFDDFVLVSTDRTSHGAGAGCFPQHTQETGYMSAGAGRHGCVEET